MTALFGDYYFQTDSLEQGKKKSLASSVISGLNVIHWNNYR